MSPVPESLVATAPPCTACGGIVYKLVEHGSYTRDIDRLGITRKAGCAWTVWHCEACGHVDFYLQYGD